jgi:5-amino-6-(5-phosphoribosylamino)uracil reductase
MATRPYVLLSVAMSADGYIDGAGDRRLLLSGPEDLDRVDEVRASCDAIMVGAHTVRTDDPQLLVKSARRRQRRLSLGQTASPVKVTITRSGDLDPEASFFADDGAAKLVYAGAAAAAQLAQRLGHQAEVVPLPDDAGLAWALADLASRRIGRLMVEGGARVLAQALSEGLADELQLAIAPVLVADPAAPRLLAGAAVPGRMTLAETSQEGDMAVLRYFPGSRPAS